MPKIFDEILRFETVGQTAYYSIAPKNIFDFFYEGGFLRKIPIYQRPYSWDNTNINELINDVKSVTTIQKSWFFGPLFTTQEPNSISKVSYLLDGQQRVTTIQLILLEAVMMRFAFDPELSNNLFNQLESLNKEIEQVLKKNNQGNWTPIFTPDQSIAESFQDYFDNALNVKSHTQWLDIHQDILASTRLNWLTGFNTFKSSIKEIRKSLIEISTDTQNKPTEESIAFFCAFIKKLLYDCWVIEIPLQREDYVLDIFESLNNRGKPLSLTDIIKFKTLTVGNSSSKITSYWSEIFQKIDKLESLDIIRDEDDLFKYVLNTYAKSDLTDTKALVSFFTTEFCKSESDVLKFLSDLQNICYFLEQLYDLDSSANQFLASITNTGEIEKFKIVTSVFKFAKKCSDNIRFLLFYYARHVVINSGTINSISKFLLDLTKIVVFNGVHLGKKSNSMREEMLELIYDLQNKKITFENLLSVRKWTAIDNYTYNYNLVNVKDPDIANLILAYNQAFCPKASVLINYSNSQYKKAQSEHLFPIKWTEYWMANKYSKADVSDYCNDLLQSQFFSSLKYVYKGELLKMIELNVMELEPNTTNDKNNLTGTVIEFIGNKWILNDSLNNKQKNREFLHKKAIINNSKNGFLMIPNHDDKLLGIDKYQNFTFKEIVNRTLTIIDMLVLNYEKPISEIGR